MKIKVLIVEDEVLVAEEIAAELEDHGFQVTGIAISSEECFALLKEEPPHVLLMDINIKGNQDGIETVREINKTHTIPVVYLTANSDRKTTTRALATSPSAFINKPYAPKDLLIALEIAFNKHNDALLETDNEIKKDSFFVKNGDFYTKINVADINYIEADGSYCKVFTQKKSYTLSSNLNCFTEKIRSSTFVRIHRSFIVNIDKVEAFDTNNLVVNGVSLPISKSHKKEVLELFTKY